MGDFFIFNLSCWGEKMTDSIKPKKHISVWWFAFGYFAVYIPYSFFTKMVTGGLLAKDHPQEMIDACLSADKANCDPAILDAINAVKVNSFEWLTSCMKIKHASCSCLKL